MKDELLFTNTYLNRRSNGANKAYWTKFVAKYVSLNNENQFLNQTIDSYDDDMPIFTFLSFELKRGIIIYQYNPVLLQGKDHKFSQYITAWTQQRWINGSRLSILTIYLIPSTQNLKTSKELIERWLMKKSVKILIDRIYKGQATHNDNDENNK